MKQLTTLSAVTGPHANAPLFTRGEARNPTSALLLFHGRGASAADMLGLSQYFTLPETMMVVAPHAQGAQWYPHRFIVPQEENQPDLDSALHVVDETIHWINGLGIPSEKIVIGGFSQGACLTAEYVSRNTRTFAGVLILSGGLIGSDEEVVKASWSGNLQRTPVFLGCDTNDFHIPVERVQLTSKIFHTLGAQVDERLYTNMGHTVSSDEIKACQDIIDALNT